MCQRGVKLNMFNASSDDFIFPPHPGETSQKIAKCKGQMLHAGSACTIKQLFAIFGVLDRRGKQGFSANL